MTRGIDYGLGLTNIDRATGIRYGVIPQNAVLQAWCDSSEANYGDPHCPECGTKVSDDAGDCMCSDDQPEPEPLHSWSCSDFHCCRCNVYFGTDEAYGDEPHSHYISDSEYLAETTDCVDIFVMKSPYYTRAAFCSPCAPGACYLESPDDSGERAYCFGPDWFYDSDPCPYPVWRVSDDALVYWPAGYFDGILS